MNSLSQLRATGSWLATRLLVALSIAFLLTWLAQPSNAHAANAKGNTTVLVLGDSLSASYGMRTEDGWVSLLRNRLRTTHPEWRVVNASISGETTSGGRSRLPALLQRHAPAIVVLALGANDGLRGLAPKTIEENLRAMATAAAGAGAKIVIVGMRLPPNYGAGYDAAFRAAFAAVAKSTSAALIPFLLEGFAQQRQWFQEDGIHPTAAAQPRMLANVWPTLNGLLRKASN